MKRFLVLLCVLVMTLVGANVFAGSIDYLTNQSAEFQMTLNRNAAINGADIANYNPAGTVFMAQTGLFLNAGIQYLLKPYEMDYSGTTYEQDEPSIIPSFYAVYNQGTWAAFLAVTAPAGGGRLKWDDGTATTAGLIAKTVSGGLTSAGPAAGTGATTINSQSVEAYSMYLGFTLGGAYKINDMFSVSLAGRFITAQRSAKAKANFDADLTLAAGTTNIAVNSDFDYEANGYGAIIGFDIRPMTGLLIALRYETVTQLEFEYSMNKREAVVATNENAALAAGIQTSLLTQLAGLDNDGKKLRYDLPAMASFGANYTIMQGLDVMVSFNYFFLKQADWEGSEDNYDNGWEAGIGFTYAVLPNQLTVGVGFLYTVSGEKADYYVVDNAHLNSYTIGLGATYTVMPDLNLTLAASHVQYLDDSKGSGTSEVEFSKQVWNFAFGVQYRLAM